MSDPTIIAPARTPAKSEVDLEAASQASAFGAGLRDDDAASELRSTDYQRLAEFDWSFADRKGHSPLEALHPYPAKFIHEIPRTLIEALPPRAGTAILDPFCGSGTTLAAAQEAGIPSIGIDLNPVACLIARVRTGSRPTRLPERAESIATSAERRSGAVAVPAIPRLAHWFKSDVQQALARLTGEIRQVEDGTLRDALSLALSSIVVRVSNQDSDTRYAAVEKAVDASTVYASFRRAAGRIDGALAGRDYRLTDAVVVEQDALTVAGDQIARPIGLVVTSPPYPNAYEYWLYHKYRMWWLGKDPLAVKEQEIGARAHFFGKDPHTPQHFGRQMGKVLDTIRTVIVPGGHACFIVGRSTIRGEFIDNAQIIADEGRSRGFANVMQVERVIASTRKSFNLSHANIKKETVLILRADMK